MRYAASLLLLSFLFLILFTEVAFAESYTLSPSGDRNNQIQISSAIRQAAGDGGGTVYLRAGVYDISGPVTIKSNIRLTGDPDAIIRVWAETQWFTGQVGVISNPGEVISNVEIDNFQIDGNIKNLPRKWDSTPGHARDCERLIMFGGWSNNFGKNIKIHNMKLYNSFSDGIYLRFVDGVQIYDNVISNCQHEGFYLTACMNGEIYNNRVAGITSDCGRIENCQNFKVFDNLFFSYNGESWGAWKGGENGLQIGDQGTAKNKGWTPTKKPLTTKNIEVFNNTFADPGLRAIWLHNGENVYIHDNHFIDASGLETLGVPVGDISYENPPSIEQSTFILDLLASYKGQTSIEDYQHVLAHDPVKTQADREKFFSPNLWMPLFMIIILIYGIKINLRACFKW